VSKKTPEEIANLKAKYAADNAEKEAKKAAKKDQFGKKNAEQNLPVCEISIPWCWPNEPANGPIAGKEIDLDTPFGRDWLDSLEYHWRCQPAFTQAGYDPSKIYRGPCKRRIIRT
jgi:hypothetical protein